MDCRCVHIRLLASSSITKTLQSLRQRGHRAICRGKSVSHVVGLKPVNMIQKIHMPSCRGFLRRRFFGNFPDVPPQMLQKSIGTRLVLCVCEPPLRRSVSSSIVQHDRAKGACTCDELGAFEERVHEHGDSTRLTSVASSYSCVDKLSSSLSVDILVLSSEAYDH